MDRVGVGVAVGVGALGASLGVAAAWVARLCPAVARATPYPSTEVPSSTPATMATVATLFTPARMVTSSPALLPSGSTTHRGSIWF